MPSTFAASPERLKAGVTAILQVSGLNGASCVVPPVPGGDAGAKPASAASCKFKEVRDSEQPILRSPRVEVTQTDRTDTEFQGTLDASGDVVVLPITLKIENAPSYFNQERTLLIQVAGRVVSAAYTVRTRPSADFSWVVRAPTDFAGRPGAPIPVTISVPHGVTATGVRVDPLPSLFEKSNGATGPGRWLSKTEVECTTTHTVEAIDVENRTIDLWLNAFCPKPKLTYWPLNYDGTPVEWARAMFSRYGEFRGKLLFTSAEKPEGETVSVTIKSTSVSVQMLGGVLLLLSVAITSYFWIPEKTPTIPVASSGANIPPDPLPTPSQTSEAAPRVTQHIASAGGEPQVAQRGAPTQHHVGWRRPVFGFLVISTTLVGIYDVVLSGSFGTAKDLFACVICGLGLPVGSSAVTNIVAVAAKLGLNVIRP